MAEKEALFESFLNCYVCLETFRDPVSLGCNHSFCSSCLQKFWEKTGEKICPVCRRKSSKESLPINFSLKELADSFAQREGDRLPEKETEEEEVMCSKHSVTPYWFCLDDQTAVCPVCGSSIHQHHKVVPIEEAVSEQKEQLKSDLKSLQDKKDKYKEVQKKYDEITQHFNKQLQTTERQIRAEFNKLQQFLKEEEESRVAALKEDEEKKKKTVSKEVKMIEEQMSSLSDSMSVVKKHLKKQGVAFLTTYKSTQSRARAQSSGSVPQLVSGVLIDVARHLGNLSFTVWKKMKDKAHFSPVILDPNTAHPLLHLSDDLTSVRRRDKEQQLPDNPERHTKYVTVNGSKGFSSGIHCWDVEVGDHPDWNVGLVKESIDKNATFVSQKQGIWCLMHRGGKYCKSDGEPVPVRKSVQRIGIHVDYDKGKVTIYDPEAATLIYAQKETLTGKLFPLFNIGKAGDAKTTELKVHEAEIFVKASQRSK